MHLTAWSINENIFVPIHFQENGGHFLFLIMIEVSGMLSFSLHIENTVVFVFLKEICYYLSFA